MRGECMCVHVCACAGVPTCVSEMVFFEELPAFLSVFASINPPCLSRTHFCLLYFLCSPFLS